MNKDASLIEATALQLLARREHTQYELHQKLQQRGFETSDILPVLEKLIQEGWQSDTRFAECYVSERAKKGYGPLKIFHELRERGLSSELIDEKLKLCGIDWSSTLQQLLNKKFKDNLQSDFKEKAKQIRFLQHRGFDLELISRLSRSCHLAAKSAG